MYVTVAYVKKKTIKKNRIFVLTFFEGNRKSLTFFVILPYYRKTIHWQKKKPVG